MKIAESMDGQESGIVARAAEGRLSSSASQQKYRSFKSWNAGGVSKSFTTKGATKNE
jgi:hypothetical protein